MSISTPKNWILLAHNIANPCKVCGKPDREKAMCFRQTDHCCDEHRKILTGELPWSEK